jgi:tRNA modification GTPase
MSINERQKINLERAKESLLRVKESIANDMPEDFFTIDLLDAYESLGLIIGESVNDDLVNQIFAEFCTGK